MSFDRMETNDEVKESLTQSMEGLDEDSTLLRITSKDDKEFKVLFFPSLFLFFQSTARQKKHHAQLFRNSFATASQLFRNSFATPTFFLV